MGSFSSPCILVFQVKRLEPELVTPPEPTPHEQKVLSEIDNQEGLRFQTPFILSYNNNPSLKQNDLVKVIKEALSSVIACKDQQDLVQKCLYFGPEEIRGARKHLPPHLTCSTFELITACTWKCRTIALAMDPDEAVRLSLVVNARGKRNNVVLPLGFYGNGIGFPGVVSTAELLCQNPLGYAVDLVKEAKYKMNQDYIKSVADLLALRGWPPLTLAGNNFILSDNTRTGVGEVDFGWGKPIIAVPAKSVNLISFYVRDSNQNEKYRILVPVCLPFRSVERFEQEFKRLTLEPEEEG
ncbi:hypothetical protein ACE6H2_016202 [Prunus campanulata]